MCNDNVHTYLINFIHVFIIEVTLKCLIRYSFFKLSIISSLKHTQYFTIVTIDMC